MLATGCAVMMRSSYNNGGLLGVFQVQCIWAKFTHLIWIYWLLMWYFVFLSNFGICYKCTVSYRYLLLRIAIHISTPVSAVYRCIVSALNDMRWWTHDHHSSWINRFFITMMSRWAPWHLKSPVSRFHSQPFVSGTQIKNHQSSTSLAFVSGIHWQPVYSPHKGPVMWKMFLFHDVIMLSSKRKENFNYPHHLRAENLCIIMFHKMNLQQGLSHL